MTHRLPIARAMAAEGWEIHVAAPDDHVWAPADFSVKAISDEGFQYHCVPLSRRGRNPLQEIRTCTAIWRLMRRLQPDLVHLLTIKPVIYGGLAAKAARVNALICTVTGLGQIFVASGLGNTIIRKVVGILYRIAFSHRNLRVIVQNESDGEVLLDAGTLDRDRLRLVRGSGVNLKEFQPVDPPDNGALVVLPARLIWEKGVGEFVAAARLVRARGVEARFALIGDTHQSNPRAVPAAQIEAWVAEGAIEWWGRRTDMPNVLAQSAIVCLPSTYGEGVPKVLIEAAAVARPIVATDIPGCRAVVRDGENGLLIPPGDTQALANALGHLIADPNLRRRMGERGREIVESGFGESHVVRQTIDIYAEVLSASSP